MDTEQAQPPEQNGPSAAPKAERAPSTTLWVFALVLIWVGMASTAALLVDYSQPTPTFCGYGSGCSSLRMTPYAHPFGISMPLFGFLAWFGQAIVWNMTNARGRIIRLVWATATSAVALALIVVQLKLGQFCWLCLVTDTSTVALLVLAAVGNPAPHPKIVVRALAWLSVMLLGIGVASYGFSRPPRLPEAGVMPQRLTDEIANAPPGKVVILDFADFECPYCKMNHETLTRAIAAVGKPVHVVRKHVPLDRIHPLAHGAARVAICAEQLGHGEEVAEALFALEEPTATNCTQAAIDKGVDPEKLAACVLAPSTEERIKNDSALFNETRGENDGLPLIWIGTRKFVGSQPPALLEAALREAAQ